MKKYFYLLMLVLPCFMISACGDDAVDDDFNEVVDDATDEEPEVVNHADMTSDGELFDGALYYKITSNDSQCREVMVTGCEKQMAKVVIPSLIEYYGSKYSVTSIGYGSFKNCHDLTRITIPCSIKRIQAFCFPSDTKIEYLNYDTDAVDLPAFGSNLKEIIIGNHVTSIGDMLCMNFIDLTSLTIGNSVESIGSYSFNSCDNLKNVTIGKGMKSIGENAFRNCESLTDVTCLAKNAPSLGSRAFKIKGHHTLHVLPGCKESYVPYWNFTIVEDAHE